MKRRRKDGNSVSIIVQGLRDVRFSQPGLAVVELESRLKAKVEDDNRSFFFSKFVSHCKVASSPPCVGHKDLIMGI